VGSPSLGQTGSPPPYGCMPSTTWGTISGRCFAVREWAFGHWQIQLACGGRCALIGLARETRRVQRMECVREDLSFSRQALQTKWPQGRHRGWAMNPSQLLHSSRPGGGGALRSSAVSRWLCRVEKSVRDSWLYEDMFLLLKLGFWLPFRKT